MATKRKLERQAKRAERKAARVAKRAARKTEREQRKAARAAVCVEKKAKRQAEKAARTAARAERRAVRASERAQRGEAPATGPRTAKGRWFWKDRVVVDDWRIQEHVRFGRVRVISPDGRRAHTGTSYSDALAVLEAQRPRTSGRGEHLAILLHGYGGGLERMSPLRDAVRAAGFAAEVIQYPSIFRTVEEIVATLTELVVTSVQQRARAPERVSLVGFSMGGLVASGVMRALALRKDAPPLGRLLTIGTPHAGSVLANVTRWLTILGGPNIVELTTFNRAQLEHLRQLPVPLGVIGGTDYRNVYYPVLGDGDGIVPIASAIEVPGAVDRYVVRGVKHTGLPRMPEVAQATVRFLESGRFPRA